MNDEMDGDENNQAGNDDPIGFTSPSPPSIHPAIGADQSLEFVADVGNVHGVITEIRSHGGSDLQIHRLEIEGEHFSLADLSQELPIEVPARESLSVEVLFTPLSRQEAFGTLRIHSNANLDPLLEIPLHGNPACAEWELSAAMMFGDVEVGESKTEPLLLENCAEYAELVINEVEFRPGPERYFFAFEPAEEVEFPLVIAPGQMWTYPIIFSPEVEGEHIAHLSVITDSTAGNGSQRGVIVGRVFGVGVLPE